MRATAEHLEPYRRRRRFGAEPARHGRPHETRVYPAIGDDHRAWTCGVPSAVIRALA